MSATDTETPRFTFKEAAPVTGIEHNTLRSYFARGIVRLLGKRGAKGGVPSLLNVRDVMTLAVAQRLIAMGFDPAPSFNAAVTFTHSGNEGRRPGKVYDPREGETVLLFWPSVGVARVRLLPHGEVLDGYALAREQGPGVLILPLNDVESEVLAGLAPLMNRPAPVPTKAAAKAAREFA